MLIGVLEQQLVELRLRLLDAAQGIAADRVGAAHRGARGSRRGYGLIAVQLLGQLLAPAHRDGQLDLRLLGVIGLLLELREIAALVAWHQT